MYDKTINKHLYLSLILLIGIPSLYESIKIAIANFNDISLSVLSQIEWFDLINETLTAFLITPCYFIFNKYKEKNIILNLGILSFLTYIIFSLIVYIFVDNIVLALDVKNNLSITSNYLRLETLGFVANFIFSFIYVIQISQSKNFYKILLLKLLLLFSFDVLLSPLWDIYGLAISNIVTNIFLDFILIFKFIQSKDIKFHKLTLSKEQFIDYIRIGFWEGTSIFLDNIIYAFLVVKMINSVNQLSEYWIANNLIWSFLLLPFLALSDISKNTLYENIGSLKKYIKISFIIFGIWILIIPIDNLIFKYLFFIEDTVSIMKIVIMLLPFYLCYMVSTLITNYFTANGMSLYKTIISLIINIIYYGLVYLIYLNIEIINIDFVVLMFGFGMFFNMIICLIVLKKFVANTI